MGVKISPHDLRRSFAKLAIKRAALEQIQFRWPRSDSHDRAVSGSARGPERCRTTTWEFMVPTDHPMKLLRYGVTGVSIPMAEAVSILQFYGDQLTGGFSEKLEKRLASAMGRKGESVRSTDCLLSRSTSSFNIRLDLLNIDVPALY